jgi:polygalacturonase
VKKNSYCTLAAAVLFAAAMPQCASRAAETAESKTNNPQQAAVALTAAEAAPDSPFHPPNIPQPTFDESRQYNIKDFGAVGDGKTNDTPAINQAIAKCNADGGGVVNIPAGTYEVASVHIKSNVCLKLDDKAMITGAATGYDPREPNEFDKFQDGGHSHFHNSVMWGEDIENFAILGGHVSGGKAIQGDKRSNKKKKPTTKRSEEFEEAKPEGEETAKNEPPLDPPSNLDPNDFGNKVIAIKNGRNLLFKGVTHDIGAHFVYLLNNCENITIANDVIKKSRDAIDLMGCRNVQVYGCHYTGCVDDTLGIKSDYAQGKRILSENIYAWDDYFESGCNGLQFGSETAGDFRNVYCWNIKIGLAMKAGIGITSNDSANIENVWFDNIQITAAANPIFMLLTNRLRTGEPNVKTGTIRNVKITNVTISDMKKGRQGPIHCATISGRPEATIDDVLIENVKITYPGGEDAKEATTRPAYPKDYSPGSMKARPASGFYIRNAKNITLRSVEVAFEKPDPKPPLVASEVDGLVLDNFKAPKPPVGETIRLEKVTRLTVRNSPGLKDTELAVAENVKE